MSLHRDVLHQHARGDVHAAAVDMEHERLATESTGGIRKLCEVLCKVEGWK